MAKMKSYFIAAIILMAIWCLLAGIANSELIIGSVVVFLILLFFGSNFSIFQSISLKPKSLVYMVLYGFVFLGALIKSNIDVALRIINPRLPINPGIIKVKTNLKSPLGREILANSITLTPGTLTVETKGEFFYIHWIDVSAKNIEESTQKIVSNFEKYLEVIFG